MSCNNGNGSDDKLAAIPAGVTWVSEGGGSISIDANRMKAADAQQRSKDPIHQQQGTHRVAFVRVRKGWWK